MGAYECNDFYEFFFLKLTSSVSVDRIYIADVRVNLISHTSLHNQGSLLGCVIKRLKVNKYI